MHPNDVQPNTVGHYEYPPYDECLQLGRHLHMAMPSPDDYENSYKSNLIMAGTFSEETNQYLYDKKFNEKDTESLFQIKLVHNAKAYIDQLNVFRRLMKK